MWDRSKGNGSADKQLTWIEQGRHAIDLMGSGEWSIEGMIEREEYWSAAQQILRRIAGLTEQNPAGVLLGAPPASNDSYWPQEGTSLASTVLGLAIEFMTHPENYIGREAGGYDGGWKYPMQKVATERLHAVGVRLGIFEDRRKEYLREAEEYREAEQREAPPSYDEDEFDRYGYDFDEEYRDHEGPDPVKARRDSAVESLARKLRSVRVFQQEEELIESMLKKWKESEMSIDDFDAALREVGSDILGVPRDDRIPNVLAVASVICDELFGIVEVEKVRHEDVAQDPQNPSFYTPLHALADFMMTREGRVADEIELIAKQVKKYADMRGEAEKQHAGAYGTATTVWREFVSGETRHSLYFGCERGSMRRWKPDFLDFRKEVGKRHEDIESVPGRFYVYQPALNRSDTLFARACKVMFFESILGDEERADNGEEMPSAAYISDEFQRFITVDPVHGEQSFLDVCRSFGAFTVIACQSVANLRYAVCEFEKDDTMRRSALDIICNNTATKLFFRNSDQETSERVETICPRMPGGDVVVRIRPLSTLGVGECYASFPDGRFVRVQLDEFDGIGEPDRRVDGSNDVARPGA